MSSFDAWHHSKAGICTMMLAIVPGEVPIRVMESCCDDDISVLS